MKIALVFYEHNLQLENQSITQENQYILMSKEPNSTLNSVSDSEMIFFFVIPILQS